MQFVSSKLFLVCSNPDPKREANQTRTWEIHSRSGDQKSMCVYHDAMKRPRIVRTESQAARPA
jgi:hypothetical protein